MDIHVTLDRLQKAMTRGNGHRLMLRHALVALCRNEEQHRRNIQDMGDRLQVLRAQQSGVNHTHALEAIKRRAQLQSVNNWVKAQTDGALEELEAGLVKDLKANDPTKGPKTRVKLFTAAQVRIEAVFKHLLDKVQEHLLELAGILHDKMGKSLEKHHDADVPNPDHEHLPNIPILGVTLEEHFDKMASDTLFKFRAAIGQGVEDGESLAELVQRVAGSEETVTAAEPDDVAKKLRVHVSLLDSIEGAIAKVIHAAIQEYATEVEDQVAGGADTETRLGWQWVAVLDDNTCEECQFMDGGQWDENKEPVDDSPELDTEPPRHFGCRCALVPCDLDSPEAPEQTFDDYLSQFSRSEQEAAFGKENLRAYHRGDITANQLIGQKTNLMTLEEFKNAD